jgi:hypothetical protein
MVVWHFCNESSEPGWFNPALKSLSHQKSTRAPDQRKQLSPLAQ